MRSLSEILMSLHTIPCRIKGNNPMERLANAEKEIKALMLSKGKLHKILCEDLSMMDCEEVNKIIQAIHKAQQEKMEVGINPSDEELSHGNDKFFPDNND